MNEKFDDFMKKHAPPAEGSLRRLELPQKRNWITGLALSGVLAASLAVVMVNRTSEDLYTEDLVVSFEDELPEELQEVEMYFDEI